MCLSLDTGYDIFMVIEAHVSVLIQELTWHPAGIMPTNSKYAFDFLMVLIVSLTSEDHTDHVEEGWWDKVTPHFIANQIVW